MSQAVARVAVLIVVVGVFALAGSSALAERHDETVRSNGHLVVVENETFYISSGETVVLDRSDPERVFLENESVGEVNGSDYDEGDTTYQFKSEDGTLEIGNPTAMDTGALYQIKYAYYEPSNAHRGLFGISRIGVQLTEPVMLLFAVLLLVGTMTLILRGGR